MLRSNLRKLIFGRAQSFDQSADDGCQAGELLLATLRQHIKFEIDVGSNRVKFIMAIFEFTLESIREDPNLAVNLFGGCPQKGFECDRFGPAALNESSDPKINSMTQSFRNSFSSDNVLLRELVQLAARLFINLVEPGLELYTAGFTRFRSAAFNCREACIKKLS